MRFLKALFEMFALKNAHLSDDEEVWKLLMLSWLAAEANEKVVGKDISKL